MSATQATSMPRASEPLLSVRDLAVEFETDEGPVVRAVDGVSFDLHPGEVLGVVGESGCGKSVTAMSLLRLIPQPPGRYARGQVLYGGQDLLRMPVAELRAIRGSRISMIFQDPMQSLSPLHRIGTQLVETVQLHRPVSRQDAWALGCSWMEKVGIPAARDRMMAYPHELSGGMRQRVMIAMALMLEPELVIADEPTTALDVTIQAQIFDLMMKMKGNRTAVMLITHDMGVIWELCDRVMVMYASRIVEQGTVDQLFRDPLHPYTRGLLASMPRVRAPGARLTTIPGQVPSPSRYPVGCHFADRCPHVSAPCRASKPLLYPQPDHRASACFLHAPEGSR